MSLTTEEKDFFAQRGYLVRQVRLDPQQAGRAIDLMWANVDPKLRRDDPSSWVGDVRDSCRVASIAKRRGRVKLRENVRAAPFLREMIYGNPDVLEIVKDLLGPSGKPRAHIRGLYPIFPSPTSSNKLQGGMDGHPFQVCCIIYLSDVEPSGGGFTVWEGSHWIMQHAFDGKATWTLNANTEELTRQAMLDCPRVELPGRAGTAIFWHHRLLHTPSTNRRPSVRQALIGDFLQSDWEDKAKAALPHEPDLFADWAITCDPVERAESARVLRARAEAERAAEAEREAAARTAADKARAPAIASYRLNTSDVEHTENPPTGTHSEQASERRPAAFR